MKQIISHDFRPMRSKPMNKLGVSQIILHAVIITLTILGVVWYSSIRPFHQLDARMPNWTSNSYNICQLDVQFICHSLIHIYKENSPLN